MTLIIGMKTPEGFVIVGDRRIAYNRSTGIFNDYQKKIIKINEKRAVALAGSENRALVIIEKIIKPCLGEMCTDHGPMSPPPTNQTASRWN